MAVFVYKIVNSKGKSGTGKLSAPTKKEAEEMLKATGCDIIKLYQPFFSLDSDEKLNSKELINFFSSMASMDKVGVDMLEALQLMKEAVAVSKRLQRVCEKIYDNVSNGMTLSNACKSSSKSFTHDFLGLIEIAENTGNFAHVFEEIVEYIKWSYAIKQQAKSAVRGPLGTMAFVVTMIIVMSNVMLPKIIDFLQYFGTEPPIYTKALISFSSFVQHKWYIILGAVAGFYIITKLLSKANGDIAAFLDLLKLKIPVLGTLLLKLDTSRFISFFELMYNSGADILKIVDGVSKVVANEYLARRIRIMKQNIMDGDSVFIALNKETIFPVMFRKMMAICEKTGEVGPVLENVKYFYDKEVKETTEKVVGILKPATTILLGGMIAWMGLSMLGPIYSNIGGLDEISNGSSSSKGMIDG